MVRRKWGRGGLTPAGLGLLAVVSACSSEVVGAQPMATSSAAGGSAGAGGSHHGTGTGGSFSPGGGGPVGGECNQSCGTVFGGEAGSCLGCAIANGSCDEQYDACFAEPECAPFESCVLGCGNDGTCHQACYDAHPVGGPVYDSLFYCLVCFVDLPPGELPCAAVCSYSCTVP